MPTPDTVLDLGANIGLVAADYQARWPGAWVWMVEPNPENFALARRNAPDCDGTEAAVGVRSGYGWLREEGLLPEAYTLAPGYAPGNRKVVIFSLASFVAIVGRAGGIDFVKMDVEGVEWELLQHADQFVGVRHLLVEFHGGTLAEGIEAVESVGFTAQHHPPHPMAVFGRR